VTRGAGCFLQNPIPKGLDIFARVVLKVSCSGSSGRVSTTGSSVSSTPSEGRIGLGVISARLVLYFILIEGGHSCLVQIEANGLMFFINCSRQAPMFDVGSVSETVLCDPKSVMYLIFDHIITGSSHSKLQFGCWACRTRVGYSPGCNSRSWLRVDFHAGWNSLF